MLIIIVIVIVSSSQLYATVSLITGYRVIDTKKFTASAINHRRGY